MMPDITPEDWVKVGGALAAVLIAIVGWIKGDRDHKSEPPEPAFAAIGGAIVDRQSLEDLTEAVRDVSKAMREGIVSAEKIRRDEVAEAVKDNSEKIEDLMRQLEQKGRR